MISLKALGLALGLSLLAATPAAAQNNRFSIDRSQNAWVVSFEASHRVMVHTCSSGIYVIFDVGPGRNVSIQPGQWAQLEIYQGFSPTWSDLPELNRC